MGLHVDMMQLRAERGRLLDRCGAWPFAAGGPQRLVCLLKGSRGPKHICQLLMSGGSPPQISSQNPSFLTLMKGRFGISVRLMQGCSERPPSCPHQSNWCEQDDGADVPCDAGTTRAAAWEEKRRLRRWLQMSESAEWRQRPDVEPPSPSLRVCVCVLILSSQRCKCSWPLAPSPALACWHGHLG